MAQLKPVKFIEETRREIKKVTWPTRKETMLTTIMVFIMVTLSAIFLFTADQLISYLIKLILRVEG